MKSPGSASSQNSNRSPQRMRAAADNVDHSLQLAVMVWAGFGVWLNNHRTSPQLTGPGTRVRNRGGSCHSRRLGRVGVQLPCAHDFYSMRLPIHEWLLRQGYTVRPN